MWETGNILNITFSGSVCSAHQAPLKPESWHVGVHAYPLLYRVNRLFSWMCLGPVYPLATSVVARVIARVSRLRFRPLLPHTAAAGVLRVRCPARMRGCMHFRLDTSLKTGLRILALAPCDPPGDVLPTRIPLDQSASARGARARAHERTQKFDPPFSTGSVLVEAKAIWLEFRQRLSSQSTFTAQSVRIFSRTPDDLRFPLKYLFYTQCIRCIRNQHSQFS